MKADHVNPFIISICKIMKDMCMLDLQIGQASMVSPSYDGDSSIIKLGLVGNLKGEVVLNFSHEAALGLVSKMMMMPVETIDAIGQSAISEMGNMVAGNAATVFANNGVVIDITPPEYKLGADHVPGVNQMISIPFTSEIGNLSVDVYIEE